MLQKVLHILEQNNELKRITQEVDPNLEIADIHLQEFQNQGKALFFERVKGTRYACVSNLFGTLQRSELMFSKTLPAVKKLVELKTNPQLAFKNPFKYISLLPHVLHALPKQTKFPRHTFEEIKISDLPLIKHWPMDGGAFVTLPQVYSEDPEFPGIMHANLGMYRIQLTGNEYELNKEIGLHYQLHRGIGVHQTKWNNLGKPMKVSVFVGGHPAHTFSAVMPLPEGISELTFAGVLAGKRFSYSILDGYVISNDADFVITGEVYPNQNKPEGPFGDHFGYYSLTHDFPVLKIHKVLAKKNAIWPFTVVGRPPQEDTQFGALVHEVAGKALSKEIPGLVEVNAVDAAGVHPLLLAIGKERYTPYQKLVRPQEILTIANHILGKGQLSLAKYVWISNYFDDPTIHTHNIKAYFEHVLSRVDWARDVHFYTQTTIDTLDYSGDGLNTGSKVVIAAAGEVKRKLGTKQDVDLIQQKLPKYSIEFVLNGVLAITINEFTHYHLEQERIQQFTQEVKAHLNTEEYTHFPLWILCDDAQFVSQHLNNWLWVTFTRSNPAYDIYGVDSFTSFKHWGCNGPLFIDARKKPHLAPELVR